MLQQRDKLAELLPIPGEQGVAGHIQGVEQQGGRGVGVGGEGGGRGEPCPQSGQRVRVEGGGGGPGQVGDGQGGVQPRQPRHPLEVLVLLLYNGRRALVPVAQGGVVSPVLLARRLLGVHRHQERTELELRNLNEVKKVK